MSSKQVKPIPFTEVTEVQKQKFWAKVDRRGPEECWPWTAAVSGKAGKKRGHCGFGATQSRRVISSTRVGWIMVHGKDPYPLHVLHTCDNGICHNPTHWFLGTNAENIADRNRKDRGGVKLRNEQVRIIKTRIMAGEKYVRIAANSGVTPEMIGLIANGKKWKHVQI